MGDRRAFLQGFLFGALFFVAANLLAAHLRSDCGIPAVLGRAGCADDIRRAGFPFLFWEEGGFAYRRTVDQVALVLDIVTGLSFAVTGGLVRRRWAGRVSPHHSD
jgi:uncharacterized membrane protein (UPF0136 family)